MAQPTREYQTKTQNRPYVSPCLAITFQGCYHFRFICVLLGDLVLAGMGGCFEIINS